MSCGILAQSGSQIELAIPRCARSGQTTGTRDKQPGTRRVLMTHKTFLLAALVAFYDDLYGHDAALEKVLAKGYPYPG
jgi:hypothetical protein